MSLPGKNLWFDFFSKKNESDITVLSTLKSNQLFSKLSQKELTLVAKMVHVRQFDSGEVVFAQYEKGLGMYMIAKGSVEIKVRTPEGPEVLVTTLEPGSFFGELALIDQDNKRTASAYAQEPSVLIGFFKPDLMEITERKPETGIKILFQLSKVLGKRLNETTEALTQVHRDSDKAKKKTDSDADLPEPVKIA